MDDSRGTEKALFHSRLVNVVETDISAPTFIIVDGRLPYCNKSFCDLLGVSPSIAPHTSPDQFFHDQYVFQEALEICDRDGSVRDLMIRCKSGQGKEVWCLLNLSRHKDSHGIFYAGTLQDQTPILARERLLRDRHNELKKLSSQLDRFIYSASHDIRQPIASIMGLIHLMQMEPTSAQQADYLDKIQESVIKLDDFLSKIQQFSKNGHERVVSHEVDFNAMIEKKLVQFSEQINARRINVTCDISSDMSFFADPARLDVAVGHLLKNCLDYYDPCKSESYIKILVSTYTDRCIIEVIDNGIGISKNHLDRVTEMFYRGTERSKGSGLGLYIVNEIAIKLKGSLLIDSEYGLGTMVRLEIPNGIKGQLVNRKRLLANQSHTV